MQVLTQTEKNIFKCDIIGLQTETRTKEDFMKKLLSAALVFSILLCTACGESKEGSTASGDNLNSSVSRSDFEELSSESTVFDESGNGEKSPVVSLNAESYCGSWIADSRSFDFFIDGKGTVKDKNSGSEESFDYKLSGNELTLTYSGETSERATVEVIDKENIIIKWDNGNEEKLSIDSIGDYPDPITE